MHRARGADQGQRYGICRVRAMTARCLVSRLARLPYPNAVPISSLILPRLLMFDSCRC